MNYSIDITEEAEEHLKFFYKNDKRLVKKINNLIKDLEKHPKTRIGKPERLKYKDEEFYLINFNKEILKYLIKTQNEYIFIDAYGDIELEDFLNLDAGFKERLKVVY